MELWVMHHTLQYKFYNAVNQVATEKNIKIEIVDFYRQWSDNKKWKFDNVICLIKNMIIQI